MKSLGIFLNISIALLIIYSVGMVVFGLPQLEEQRQMILTNYIEPYSPEFIHRGIEYVISHYAEYFTPLPESAG